MPEDNYGSAEQGDSENNNQGNKNIDGKGRAGGDRNNDAATATSLAARLRSLRAQYGMTQAEAAKKLNISQQTYSNYEKENSRMDSAMLKCFCRLYGVSADYLLGLDDTPSAEKGLIQTIADEVAYRVSVVYGDGKDKNL